MTFEYAIRELKRGITYKEELGLGRGKYLLNDIISFDEALMLAIESLEKQKSIHLHEVTNDSLVTNADRIRSMSDEELNQFLLDFKYGNISDKIKLCSFLKWLRQEVE